MKPTKLIIFLFLLSTQVLCADMGGQQILGALLYPGSISSAALERKLHQMALEVSGIKSLYDFETIDMPGIYELAHNVLNEITISASNVTLDLNGCTVSGGTNGIVINGGLSNITIKNGSINSVSSDGIQINAGCSDIKICNVEVKNALRAINFERVSNSIIENCDLNLSTTGLELEECYNVIVRNCTARANTHAGYDLLTSTTCSLLECQALSTGDGNSNIQSEVFGFVAKDGNGNLFERCIANATQALSVTGSDSIVAGFALRGDESCTKIIDSESSNSETSTDGASLSYGILLDSVFDGLTTLTLVETVGPDHRCAEISWSPDGRFYVEVGNNNNRVCNVLSYDYQSNTTRAVANFDVSAFTQLQHTDWHPGGRFICLAGNSGGDNIRIIEFDGANDLQLVGSAKYGEAIRSCEWSPDGRYLVVTGTVTGSIGGQIYFFDSVSKSLQLVTSIISTTNVLNGTWSPGGQFLAIGKFASGSTNEIEVYSFDGRVLTLIDFVDGLGNIGSLGWSPDGQYLVAFGVVTTTGLRLYRFDGTSLTLTDSDTTIGSLTLNSSYFSFVSWTPDSRFFSVSGINTPFVGVSVYAFDAGTETFLLQDSYVDSFGATAPMAIWSPDGSLLAVGRSQQTENTIIFTGMNFPENNVIQGNTVYCNSGGQFPSGIGISGSSISNSIIQNTAFNNPIPRGDREPVVESNYAYVINVFNQLFGDAPTTLQNISLSGIDPILNRYDIPTKLLRLEALAESLIDSLL